MPARILIIEDNAVNLELMTYLLEAWQHRTLCARDGAEGLALARRDRPDLIVCDVQLPGLDGYAVARALKADPATRDIPLVALTAYAMVGDREQALEAGFDRYFPKPFVAEQLMSAIESLLPGRGHAPAPGDDGGSRALPVRIPPALRAPRTPSVLLLVDDGPLNLEYKRSLFEPAGYEVVDAGDVAAALARLRDGRVDLVLSDVVMPGGGGFELLRRLRADPGLARLPLIFLTSSARDDESRARGLALGADRYLVRPIDALELLAAIRDCLLAH